MGFRIGRGPYVGWTTSSASPSNSVASVHCLSSTTTYDGASRRGCRPARTTSILLLLRGSWYSSSTSTWSRPAWVRSSASTRRLLSQERISAADARRFIWKDICSARTALMRPSLDRSARPRAEVRNRGKDSLRAARMRSCGWRHVPTAEACRTASRTVVGRAQRPCADTQLVSDIEGLTLRMRQFTDARDWAQFHDPKSLMLALVGEVGELAELLQWMPHDDQATLVGQEPLRGRLAEEMSDVLLYLLRL